MKPATKTAFRDAKNYRDIAKDNSTEKYSRRVILSNYIMAVIRGNDALCLHYLDEKPGSHGEAPKYFKKLYESHKIPEKYSKYYETVENMERMKSKIQYKNKNLSKTEFQRAKKRASRFLEKAVEPNLES